MSSFGMNSLGMNSIDALDISASALAAQRVRMNAIAGNIANASTTRDADGRNIPYKRLEVLFAAAAPGRRGGTGVQVEAVQESRDPYRWVHDPDHPDAVRDPSSPRDGYVLMPRVNAVEEMVDMMLASRSYEANLSAMEVTRAMKAAALRIIA
jgi:flagellar basal-body rod protein FlgC